MEELDKYINNMNSILDAEQEDLAQSKRQHHTDWDNHILTLSTASLGFIFSFLPISTGCYFPLVVIGVFSFISSICFATTNYIFADKGINFALDSIANRRALTLKLEISFSKFKQNKINAEADNNEKAYKVAQNKCDEDIGKIFEKFKIKEDIHERDKINKIINFLNYAKTYAFIAGIIFTVSFSLLNMDKIS